MKLGASYFGNRTLKHVKSDVEQMAQDGCNFVVHTMSEEDVAYYSETMMDIVKVSKDAGLEVHLDPWAVGQVFGGESFSNFVKLRPDARQQLSLPECDFRVNKACLNSRTFRQWMALWIDLAARTGADGVFWDEPHLYFGELAPLFGPKQQIWGCVCNTCKNIFKDTYGYEMPLDFTEDVKKFRQWTLLNFIEYLCNFASDMGLKNSICIFPTNEPKYGIYEWEEVLKIKNIDVFGSDPYWLCFNKKVKDFVGTVSRQVIDLCKKYNKEAQIWIQGFRVPSGKENEVSDAIQVAYDTGIRNIATWSFEAGACMSYIKSERPSIVWENIVEKYRKLAGR
ncbi:MAG: hypothetical protein HYW14_04900 [Planctomycetes bacterium]|nr:hypothetical protein [Planctomycetota bacterium]